jgi:hypothetical protein
MELLTIILNFVIIYLSSIFFHEFGHFLYYVSRGDNARFSIEWISSENKIYSYVGNSAAFATFNKKQKIGVYGIGILFGALWLLFCAGIYSPLVIILLIPYMWGCRSDLDKIYKLIK